MEDLTNWWAQNSGNALMYGFIIAFFFKGKIMGVIFGIKNISVSEFNKVKDLSNVNLIDVRSLAEFSGQRIKTAKNIPLDTISKDNKEISQMDKTKPVYVICASGNRSLAGSFKLKKLGFDVTNIKGGMAFWSMRRFEVA